jgi:hypothetical protein
MPHSIDTITDGGSPSKLAHQNMLEFVKDFAEDSGYWEVMRYIGTGANHEVILKGEGLTGNEEIYIGFQTYESVAADYYNMNIGGFTGYNSGLSFANQPGAATVSVCSHNESINYWLTVNEQRIVLVQKVGTPIYETAYAGKIFPYARPSQYPYPLLISGTLTGGSTLRYSDVTANHASGLTGNSARMRLRTLNAWENSFSYPYTNAFVAGAATSVDSTAMRDTGTALYPMLPIELHNNNTTLGSSQLWGYVDGVFYVSGFSNSTENTIEINSPVEEYVIFQDVFRTSFNNYVAIKLDPNP